MEEEIMNVTEEVAENIAEPVTEVVEAVGKDWTSYGLVAGGIALGAAGMYGACKLAPKAVKKVKTWWADRDERKQAKKEAKEASKYYSEVQVVEPEVDED